MKEKDSKSEWERERGGGTKICPFSFIYWPRKMAEIVLNVASKFPTACNMCVPHAVTSCVSDTELGQAAARGGAWFIQSGGLFFARQTHCQLADTLAQLGHKLVQGFDRQVGGWGREERGRGSGG